MSHHGIDSGYQHVQTYAHLEDWNDDSGIQHWQGHSSMLQRPFDRHHRGFNEPQIAYSHGWFRDLNHTPPACHLANDATYPPYYSPGEDPHRPYYSSSSTLYDSSSASSDRLSPSIGSRASSLLPSSQPCHIEVAIPGLGLTSCTNEVYDNAPCVAMQNVQKNADMLNEEPMDDFNNHFYEPQELVPAAPDDYDSPSSAYRQLPIPIARMETYDESMSEPETVPEPEPESEYEPGPAPSIRRRRAPKPRPLAATSRRNGVTKRSLTQRPRSSPPLPSTHAPQETPRAFLCPLAPYGCAAAFNAKNEWKRHAQTQHFRLSFWRCDQCTSQPDRPNDFNRKDLFVQHVRRMHPTNPSMPTGNSKRKTRPQGRVAAVEVALNKTAERCYQRTHPAPESCCCVFCEESFEGESALDSRTEHVGKHMESRKRDGLSPVAVADWREDKELESWLLRHKMVLRRNGSLEASK